MVPMLAGVLLAGGPGHAWGYGGPWGLFGGVLMLLFWVAVIAGVMWFLGRGRWAHDHGRTGPTGVDKAREILAERYARGEISTEEYWERRDQL